jgi:DNA polymerase I
LAAHLVLTAYDQLVVEARKDSSDRVAQVLEKVMVEAGRDILAPVPVVVDVKMGKYWS